MTKEDYSRIIDEEFTPSEIALLNLNIYSNPEHAEYYMNYHLGKYKWCYNYLKKNRHLLTIEHTPPHRVEIAKRMIESAKAIYGEVE